MDQTVEPKQEKLLTKKDVVKAFWRWTFFSHANYNYERLQATGVVHAFSPILKKLYGKDEDEMKAALERHMQFFNTEPSIGGPVLSMTIAMEEERAMGADINDQTINGLKTGLMGPLAGIGDTLWQGTLIPILLSFTLPFGAEGNIFMGPVLFFALHWIIMTVLAYVLWIKGYEQGKEGIQKMMAGGQLSYIMTFSQTLGAVVIGSLAANFVKIATPLSVHLSGKESLSIQTDVLDSLVKGILPLGVTLITYYLLKHKKYTPTKVLAIQIVGGAILAALGLIVNSL
ncbi:PTS system mannose/fructose/sorbose family transporter subunit IID [Enterococcus pseudoavium]|uniref:PTS system mannose/fructose/sorbose family transporter subunit IID n=1 Tax=Enterococcus pseudoavium TaxID=44007 RepID=A0AAE4I1U1_9ENTE|nr:PTS system mannose/fructose/sorbose family transporter subunit IID [Enterococcus pseudoavium]MDT2737303.1 PTS system mannose/fructose/sorbose family transporter subunit IID [Enterococcus pseudoavium]